MEKANNLRHAYCFVFDFLLAENGPQTGTLLVSWTPVTNQPKPPSRAAVHSYLIYADGKNIAQVPSATGKRKFIKINLVIRMECFIFKSK
uniref:ADF-H domain-containing protein n=1 Tax=Heterorhabditis bacteriophora TaxID=37862 RepID=A0A1I7XAF3_HETBA